MSKKEKEAKEEKQPQEKAEKTSKVSEKKDEKKESETDMLKKQLEEANDKFLRLNAEYQNFKRRSEKEKQETYSFAKVDIIKELLPVIDNLERAIASDGNNDYDGLKKGVEMTFDSLMTTLSKLGIEVYGESGETFDPNLHNAVMHIEDDKYKDGEIVDVFQKGYKAGDKIIRAAMVRSAN